MKSAGNLDKIIPHLPGTVSELMRKTGLEWRMVQSALEWGERRAYVRRAEGREQNSDAYAPQIVYELFQMPPAPSAAESRRQAIERLDSLPWLGKRRVLAAAVRG